MNVVMRCETVEYKQQAPRARAAVRRRRCSVVASRQYYGESTHSAGARRGRVSALISRLTTSPSPRPRCAFSECRLALRTLTILSKLTFLDNQITYSNKHFVANSLLVKATLMSLKGTFISQCSLHIQLHDRMLSCSNREIIRKQHNR